MNHPGCCEPCAQCAWEKDERRVRISTLESHRKQWRRIAISLRDALVHIASGCPDPEGHAQRALGGVDLPANELELRMVKETSR